MDDMVATPKPIADGFRDDRDRLRVRDVDLIRGRAPADPGGDRMHCRIAVDQDRRGPFVGERLGDRSPKPVRRACHNGDVSRDA